MMIAIAANGCARRAEPDAIRIDDPDRHWRANGFVEMVTPLAPPTSADGRDRITVWLALPDGEPIDSAALRYPPGTVADRIEYLGGRIADVRGTRFGAGGAEWFHVLHPAGDGLAGYEWPRGDADLDRRAAARVASLVEPAARDRLRRLNDCAGCHQHDRPPATRGDAPGPRRATDAGGLYQVLAVLSDAAPVDHHRPREVNAGTPYVQVDCPGGAAAELRDDGRGARHYACADGGVPIGHVDIARARRDGDDRALAVCRARRYLRDHMTAAVRAAFAPAFATCGL